MTNPGAADAAQLATEVAKLQSDKVPAAAFLGTNQSLAANGYQKLPGGLIIQWGYVSTSNSTTQQSVTFPIAFPIACLNVLTQITANDSASYAGSYYSVSGMSKTGFTTYYTTTRYYIAIGY